MPIITISRGCYSHGKEIAERVAKTLGYECISREILLDASKFFNIPEKKLLQSLHDAPSMLERITHGKEKYLSYIRAALLEGVKRGNIVYHGHAGHILIPEITHVLKVRVLAGLEDRITFLQSQRNLSRKEASDLIEKEDHQRSAWTRLLFGSEVNDPYLYHLFINLDKSLKIDGAVDLICRMVQRDTFRTTKESQKQINDLALSSHVQAALFELCDGEVKTSDGTVTIKVEPKKIRKTGYAAPGLEQKVQEQMRNELMKEILQIVNKIPDIKSVNLDLGMPYYV
jgi:cytidylate kinase